MPKSETHNAIVLRPPPGARFSLHLADVELQFQRGQERAVYEWLTSWLDTYVLPEAIAYERLHQPLPPTPTVVEQMRALIASEADDNQVIELAEKLRKDADYNERVGHPGISQAEQKLAAMGMRPVPPQDNGVQFNAQPNPPPVPPTPPAGPVVYGPNGPMTAAEIAALPDKPIPGVGYRNPNDPKP